MMYFSLFPRLLSRLLFSDLWRAFYGAHAAFGAFIVVAACLCARFAFAQGLSRDDEARSSRGRDFYLAFLPNFHEESNGVPNARDSVFIFITSDKPVSGRITYRDRRRQERVSSFSLPDPTQIYSFSLSYNDIELQGFNLGQALNPAPQNETPAPQYVRIEADNDVTVYALNQARFTSDAHLVLPVPALGREYVVMSYASDGNGFPFTTRNVGNDTPSQFAVVAVADNTELTITTTVPTFPSRGATTHSVTLQRGESYLVQADTRVDNGRGDLTGSRVQASRPVAVFGSHQRAVLPIQFKSLLSSRDHLIEQIPPLETWGKSIFLVPHAQPSLQANAGSDVYRVLAAYDNTRVLLNGQPLATLNAGQFYEAPLTQPGWITANEQILVAQFKKTATPAGLGGGVGPQVGDPFMMVIPTVEQYDKSYRFINTQVPDAGAAGGQSFTEHYVTIVVHANGVGSMLFDERPLPANAFSPIVNSGYVFGNFRVNSGVHTARGDSAFGIYVYGYGQANSYGYIGGGRLRVIAPDRDAPRVILRQPCGGVEGVVLDTLVTDSRIGRVELSPGTAANVRLEVEPFERFADSVRFRVELINPFADGSFQIEAQDSVGFLTQLVIPVFGFTVGLQGQNAETLAPTLSLQVPTGRTRTFQLVVENYGVTAQTISLLRFTGGLSGLEFVGVTLPIVLAAGRRDTLTVSYRAPEDGVFFDTLRASGACGARTLAILRFESQTDRERPLVEKSADACARVVALDFIEDGAFAAGVESVRAEELINCALQTDTIIGARTRSLIVVQNPRLDAIYALQVLDSSGNALLIRDTIPGFTLELVGERRSAGNFGETSIAGTTNCIQIEYRNTGLTTFYFPTLAPERNLFFSMPPSQFPFEIPPGSTRRVTLCFAPSELRAYQDTLIIAGNCLGDTLPLFGVGGAPVRIVDSRCDAPLQLRTISTPSRLAIVNASPQPAANEAVIRVELSDNALVEIAILSATGERRRVAYKGGLEMGETDVVLDTQDLESGVYFCVVQAGSKRAARQIVIVR
jgi:hypothetical protein